MLYNCRACLCVSVVRDALLEGLGHEYLSFALMLPHEKVKDEEVKSEIHKSLSDCINDVRNILSDWLPELKVYDFTRFSMFCSDTQY